MKLEELEAYWNHWVSLAEAGSPLSFLRKGESQGDRDSGSEEKGGASGGDDEDGRSIEPLTHSAFFAIDEGIPLPSECDTTAERTRCLQSLVSRDSGAGKVFIKLVKLVNATEVSLILVIQSSL